MAPQQPNLDRTFVNLTHDPAEGRGARRAYIRRAVMKNYHKGRSQKKKALKDEAAATSSSIEERIKALIASIDRQKGPQPRTLIPEFSLFEQRKFPEPPMMQMSCFILRFLCGQVSKAAQDLSFVGFIHTLSQHEAEGDSENITMNLDSLKTSLNLLQAYNTYKNDSISLSVNDESLWELIHQHQEWIYSRIHTFNSWELLSAAQAATIYLLLRVKQGKNNPAFPNGDIALLYTLGSLFRRLQTTGILDFAQHPRHDWKQWVLFESFIRIATIYFTLGVVVSTEFGLPCDNPQDWNIDGMLLPATKASWAAENASDWARLTSLSPPHKQLRWKDLLAPASLNDCPVEEWKESSDELGIIVIMTMNLRSQQLRDPIPSS